MSTSLINKCSLITPRAIKIWLSAWLHRVDYPLPDGRRVFIFLAADYGNIGDLAITAAQESFLRNTMESHFVVRVPISRTRTQLRSIKKQINSADLITIVGGGNMGSLYPDIEELRQLIIRSFPNNRIVCFPQTLDWDDTSASEKALRRIVKTYSSHLDIHVFARESISREKLASLFHLSPNVNIGYAPDIVLSASGSSLGGNGGHLPSGILRCLRDDKERSLDEKRNRQLDEAIANTGEPIEITDTHAGGARLPEEECARLLADKLTQFSSARLVVTDRLHGMILSVLAGTPCLVVPNSNHKIRQTWLDWLSDHPLVAFLELEAFDTLPQVIERLLGGSRSGLETSPINSDHFASLKEAVFQA